MLPLCHPVVSTAKVQKIWEQFTTHRPHYHVQFCCFDCKSTKNLRAIHNKTIKDLFKALVVSTAKVQKIWEQFTTLILLLILLNLLFRLQKYKKFESNSQPCCWCCNWFNVVSTAKVQKIWEQFTTLITTTLLSSCCFDCKSTKNLRAIHNRIWHQSYWWSVVSTAKVQKIWEQFTTQCAKTIISKCCFDCKSTKNLRAIHNEGEALTTV